MSCTGLLIMGTLRQIKQKRHSWHPYSSQSFIKSLHKCFSAENRDAVHSCTGMEKTHPLRKVSKTVIALPLVPTGVLQRKRGNAPYQSHAVEALQGSEGATSSFRSCSKQHGLIARSKCSASPVAQTLKGVKQEAAKDHWHTGQHLLCGGDKVTAIGNAFLQ